MDQDKKNTSGAPSSDTTSALFVSARKKQLEEQEAAARAKEKEDQRLAAEAEVRRLEAEVEARRIKAAEDAKRVEAEAVEQKRRADEDAKRIAEETRQKQAQAAANPDAILGSAKKEVKLPQIPKLPKKEPGAPSKPAGQGGGVSGLLQNKKLLAIIGGGAAVIILAVVLIVTLGGNPAVKPLTESGEDFSGEWYDGTSESYNIIEFENDGTVSIDAGDGGIETASYKVNGETVTIVLDDGSKIELVLDGDYMISDDYEYILTRELVDGSVETYAPTGSYYMNGDAQSWRLTFAQTGVIEIFDPNSGPVAWDYILDEDMILAGAGEQLKIFIVIDADTIKSNEGNM
ncbi:MAG: cell envelope integrity protein TolA, partial [Oscillospiraceae bacterium]|nr:cell envelope integrity protein TolA [Oscillospiraceae bacterium]